MDKITPRGEDYSKWYQSVVSAAELASYTDVPGCMILEPNGWGIWERIQQVFDKRIKATGHKNAQFPMLIPLSYIQKAQDHIEGFAPQLAMVEKLGGKQLEDPLVLRPTSETIIHTYFAKKVQSRKDLPILINQWANVFRMEMRTRPFLRTMEFFWQEGHTAHATEEEAIEEVLKMLGQYREFIEQTLAIPCITGEKSAIERFAGADKTFTVETMMQDIKALQSATSHYLGQTFSKAFGISFEEDEEERFAHLTSWGMSTRIIGATVMSHSDDKGLVLPPNVAPTQAALLMVRDSQSTGDSRIATLQNRVCDALGNLDIRYEVDNTDERLGRKQFKWEKYGVPLRIVIGTKEAESDSITVIRRDTSNRETISADAMDRLPEVLNNFQSNLFNQGVERLKANSVCLETYDEVVRAFEEGNKFVYTGWAGSSEDERKLKTDLGITIRCVPQEQQSDVKICFMTGKPAREQVLLAKAY